MGKTSRRRRPRQRHRQDSTPFRILSYLLTNITITIFWFYLFVLNRTTVIGRHNVGKARNTLLVSNHQSMIDSFIVGAGAFYPHSLLKPHLLPWNPAAEENFFRPRVLAWFIHHFRGIPIVEGRRDPRALHRMVEVLPKGVMTICPEGTRSRDGAVGPARAGAGLLVLAARPKVIPVAIDGMKEVLPIGHRIPKIFKRIYISYGEPLDYSEFLDKPRTKETSQALIDKVMNAIEVQHAEIRRLRAGGRGRGGGVAQQDPASQPLHERRPSSHDLTRTKN